MTLLVRRHLFAFACLVLAGLIGLGAIADHRDKQVRVNRAELSEWYCRHLATRCGGPSSSRIESRWNERQVAYEIVVGLLAGAGAVALLLPGNAPRRLVFPKPRRR